MINQDAAVLFNFLKDIMFTKKYQNLNVTFLSQEFEDLGEGLNLLSKYVDELRNFSQNMYEGDFSACESTYENQLCWNLKAFQADLSQLVWKAEKVVQGDYTQHTDRLGDLGKAFNALVEIIAEKDARIKELEENTK